MLELISNDRIDPTKLITHEFYGFDKLPEAFELMDKKAPRGGRFFRVENPTLESPNWISMLSVVL